MPTLSINADDLLTALRERSPQISSWLDRETGDIYQISSLFADDEVEADPQFTDAMIATPDRYLRLPVLPAGIGFQAMREFADQIPDVDLQAALVAALARQRAFFHFQDVLATAPSVVLQWQQHVRVLMLRWADDWLQQHGIVRQH